MPGFYNFEQIFHTIKESWRLIAIVFVAVFALVIAVSALMPAIWTASADIVFNDRSIDPVAEKPDSLPFAGYISAEVDLISSQATMQRLANDPAFAGNSATLRQIERHKKGNGPVAKWLVYWIGHSVAVTNTKGTRRVSIAASADDPRFAVLLANGLAKAYLSGNLRLRVTPAQNNVQFFQLQKTRRLADLTAAQRRLDDFLKSTGMTGLEVNADSDAQQLRTLDEKLALSQAEQAGTSAATKVGGVDSAVSAGTVANPVIERLSASIAEQSAALKDLTILRGPNYPTVIEARARLTELESQFRAETAKIARGLDRANQTVTRQGATIGMIQRQKRAAISASASNRATLAVLTGDVDRAKTAYDAVAARLSEVELASSLEAPNAAILSPAENPTSPSWPNWPFAALVGIALGAIAGVLVALVKELIIPRVRTAADMEMVLGGAPMLAELGA
jgi:uncharacterized protein involved in exopolysaccharide biosynthesis